MTNPTQPSVFIPKSQIDAQLAAPVEQGKKDLEPFLSFKKENGLPFHFLRDHAVTDNKIEVHLDWHDVWHCLSGEATFELDGELVEPFYSKNKGDGSDNLREIRALTMTNAKIVTMKAGDVLYIPAGRAHRHSADGTAEFLIYKIHA